MLISMLRSACWQQIFSCTPVLSEALQTNAATRDGPLQLTADQQQADTNIPKHRWSSDKEDRMCRNYGPAQHKNVSLGQDGRDANQSRQERRSSGSREAK